MIGKTLGHYRIVEKIGAGGMGEVYRAHDQHLDRAVALKVLPAGILGDEAARKRFRKEALALSKLNHPNIATVHDFDTHDGVDFLAMELIPGTTLSRKLTGGPLELREVLRLGMQLAEGLAAAHAQGVVHRDLKPGNLMITAEGRLKILDFGLATLLHPAGDPDMTRSITEAQPVAGTVPYMSPEQLSGKAVDARSDIYASGAVLYEMATGQRVFPEAQLPLLIGAILHCEPSAPSTINSRVSPALDSVILKALDKQAMHRYQSARELLVALEGVRVGPAAPVPLLRWPIAATAIGTLVLILLAGIVLGLNVGGLRDRLLRRATRGAESEGVSLAPVKARRSIAVLGLKNLSGRPDEAWLSTALSEMLTTELAAGEQLRTVPGENVAQMKLNLSLPDADSYGKDTLTRIRSNVGADEVVLGSYLALGKDAGGQVRLDLRLQDAAAGETLATVTESGKEAEVSDLVARAGAELRRKLGVSEVPASEVASVKASLPANPEAARLYSEGLARLRVSDNLSARDLLQKAVAAEPRYPLAHSALSMAWSGLGYGLKSQDEAKKAFDLSSGLSREEQLWVEGRYRVTTHEWDKAVEIYRTLFRFFPDNLEYGLRLATAETAAGKAQEALNTVQALRKLPPPSGDDPRIDLQEAQAADWLGDSKRVASAAERAATKGAQSGARLIVAEARWREGTGLRFLGQTKAALDAYAESRKIYSEAGDKGGVVRTLLDMGNMMLPQGELSQAMQLFEEALKIAREIGDERSAASAFQNMASVLQSEGALDRAKTQYEASVRTYRRTGDKGALPSVLYYLGGLLLEQGDLAGAKQQYEEAIAIAREGGDKTFLTENLLGLGGLLFYEGDLQQAKAAYDEAATTAGGVQFKWGIAWSLLGSGDVLLNQDDLAAARQRKEDALKIFQEAGDTQGSAQAENDLAILAIEERRPAEAEPLARKVVEERASTKASDDEAEAGTVLAQALLEQRKLGEAEKTALHLQDLGRKSQNPAVRVDVNIVVASVRAASGRSAEAAKSLEAEIAKATKLGYIPGEFEARLVLGEVELRSGKTAVGRARLAGLEKDATARGFLLIARKAAAAR